MKKVRTVPIPEPVALELLDRLQSVFGDKMFLWGGTLLGAVRDGALIPWDWDVDAGMLLEDWDDYYLAKLRRSGLVIHRYRRWEKNEKTPWVRDYVGKAKGATVIQLRLPDSKWHADFHVFARGTGLHSEMRFWKRKGIIQGGIKYDKQIVLVKTPAALVDGAREVSIHGRTFRVPARSEESFDYCYEKWRTPLNQRTDLQGRLTMLRYVTKDTENVVYTAGVFDVPHYGHMRLLQRMKKCGDRLVVGVVSDDVATRIKGRPVFTEDERAAFVEGMGVADEVAVRPPTDYDLLEEMRPAAVMYGDDPAIDRSDVRAAAERLGIKVILLPRTEGISSTLIKERVRANSL